MAARLRISSREQSRPTSRRLYDKMKKARAVLNTFRAYGAPRPARGAGRRFYGTLARGASTQAAPAAYVKAYRSMVATIEWRTTRPSGRGRRPKEKFAALATTPPTALLRSRAIGHPLCRGDDQRGQVDSRS